MHEPPKESPSGLSTVILVVRRVIQATPERLFAAWTSPEALKKWWGPQSVVCPSAEVDLRVGGHYRIANQFPDGRILWITGEFEVIERPTRLIYSWQVGADPGARERVSVLFAALAGGDTEVIVTHERIASPALRDRHEQGWRGCLDGLERYISG